LPAAFDDINIRRGWSVYYWLSGAFDLDTEEVFMANRSSIKANEEELKAYFADLAAQNLWPLWTLNQSREPKSKATPYIWHWRDLRPLAMRAAELVGTKEAERRALVLSNPGTQWGAANTLFANIQVVLPGEVVRSHRHTNGALRFIIEGKIGHTVVDGQRYPMVPGDLVITPSWCWHDHANESDVPILWLDSLDAPLVRLLEVGFREDYPDEIQPPGEGNDNSQARYSSGGLRPAWEPAPSTPHTPMCRYPLEQAKAALDRLAAAEAGSPYDGIILEYTNPITGGPVMPTIGCYIQLLRPGEHTECHRHTSCVCYHVVEGSGYTVIDSQRLDWEEKDVFSVPAWAFHEHVNSSDRSAIVFSVTDIPVKRALGYYREQGSPSGRQ